MKLQNVFPFNGRLLWLNYLQPIEYSLSNLVSIEYFHSLVRTPRTFLYVECAKRVGVGEMGATGLVNAWLTVCA
jgi:hypothetical protein